MIAVPIRVCVVVAVVPSAAVVAVSCGIYDVGVCAVVTVK